MRQCFLGRLSIAHDGAKEVGEGDEPAAAVFLGELCQGEGSRSGQFARRRRVKALVGSLSGEAGPNLWGVQAIQDVFVVLVKNEFVPLPRQQKEDVVFPLPKNKNGSTR